MCNKLTCLFIFYFPNNTFFKILLFVCLFVCLLQEGDSFSFTIVRHGSALDSRFVYFNITPSKPWCELSLSVVKDFKSLIFKLRKCESDKWD